MRAAVLDHAYRAVARARHHHRRRTDMRADEVAGVGNLGFERDIVPGGPVEDALDLALIDGLVGIDPVRNFGQVAGPDILPVEQHGAVARAAPGSIGAHAITAHTGLRGACAARFWM